MDDNKKAAMVIQVAVNNLALMVMIVQGACKRIQATRLISDNTNAEAVVAPAVVVLFVFVPNEAYSAQKATKIRHQIFPNDIIVLNCHYGWDEKNKYCQIVLILFDSDAKMLPSISSNLVENDRRSGLMSNRSYDDAKAHQ